MIEDVERMLICGVCGGPSCFGFGVTLDGIRMGDVGDWRCTEHHPAPDRQLTYTREEWAAIRVAATSPSPSPERAV